MDHSPGFLALVNEAKGRIRQLDIEAYRRLREPHVLIDVREDHEWAAGHAAGAVHLGRGILERDIEKLVPDQRTTLVLYCGGGYRSALAADNLRRMGYANAISLDGGWHGWKGAGLPTEGESVPTTT